MIIKDEAICQLSEQELTDRQNTEACFGAKNLRECAIAANAHFICTEDKHFDVLKKLPYLIVPVFSADDFVEMLTGIRPKRKK